MNYWQSNSQIAKFDLEIECEMVSELETELNFFSSQIQNDLNEMSQNAR